MEFDKTLLAGSTGLMLLKLLAEQDMYGYQMIDALRRRSDHTFDLKAGTLYPLLHTLEQKGFITAYESAAAGRVRRVYRLTDSGKKRLAEKEAEWDAYTAAVAKVLKGGACFG